MREVASGRYLSEEEVEAAWKAGSGNRRPLPEGVGRNAPETTRGSMLADRKRRREWMESVRARPGSEEGIVAAFPSGHRIKLKSEEYVTLHRGRDAGARERHVLKAVLEGVSEELAALQTPERAKRMRQYRGAVENRLKTAAAGTAAAVEKLRETAGGDRGAVARAWDAAAEPALKGAGFTYLKHLGRGAEPEAALGETERAMREAAARQCGSERGLIEKVLPVLGPDPPRWDGSDAAGHVAPKGEQRAEPAG